MTDKFLNKYRISSARLQTWDYGSNGAYFITICTRGRQHFFGDIANGQMQLSEIGKFVEQEWIATPKIRPDMNLTLDAFVVMPDHFHGIIIIGDNIYNMDGDRRNAMDNGGIRNGGIRNGGIRNGGIRRGAMHCASTNSAITNSDPDPNPNPDPDPDPDPNPNPDPDFNPDPNPDPDFNPDFKFNFHGPPAPNKFGPQSKNLASIIRGFKSSVTTQAKKSGNNDFAWQSRFHDHIIRNSTEFYNIRNYIINNPAGWDKDKFHD